MGFRLLRLHGYDVSAGKFRGGKTNNNSQSFQNFIIIFLQKKRKKGIVVLVTF